MIRIKGTEWDRAACAAEASRRVSAGELSDPDSHSLDFALWTLELLKENDRLRAGQIPLVEQLRQACSIAFGDLLVHGMPPGVSTGRLLESAIGAAEEYLAQAVTSEEHLPQAEAEKVTS